MSLMCSWPGLVHCGLQLEKIAQGYALGVSTCRALAAKPVIPASACLNGICVQELSEAQFPTSETRLEALLTKEQVAVSID